MDWAFGGLIKACGYGLLLLALSLFYVMLRKAEPAISEFGLSFLWHETWDVPNEVFGGLAPIAGTIMASLLALFFAVHISIGSDIFLAELAPGKLRTPVSYLIETLAAIPSVIYGLWAIFVLVPFVRDPIEMFLGGHFSWIPLFDGPIFGLGLLSAGIILAIMILPIITAVSRDILLTVPNSQREAMIALGATRWEVISRAVIPYSRSGLVGAVILGMGRAMGETMAVTMVIGNAFKIPTSLFDIGNTIPAAIASQFSESSAGLFQASLVYLALVLFVISLAINVIARLLVNSLVRLPGRVRE
jgi:phosphate transport system permease protein